MIYWQIDRRKCECIHCERRYSIINARIYAYVLYASAIKIYVNLNQFWCTFRARKIEWMPTIWWNGIKIKCNADDIHPLFFLFLFSFMLLLLLKQLFWSSAAVSKENVLYVIRLTIFNPNRYSLVSFCVMKCNVRNPSHITAHAY